MAILPGLPTIGNCALRGDFLPDCNRGDGPL
jgi:hypothetical protein